MPAATIDIPSLRDRVSPAEWQARCDLAAACRLVALFGWDDLVFTHISARIPDAPAQFLINPYGLFFEEITASSLVKVDHHGQPLMETAFPVNPAGFVIHSAVHEGRPEINCVTHTHSLHGVAVSAQADGLLPISQQSSIAPRAFSICGFLGDLMCGEIPRAKGMHLGEKVQNAAMETRAGSALGQRSDMLLGWPN